MGGQRQPSVRWILVAVVALGASLFYGCGRGDQTRPTAATLVNAAADGDVDAVRRLLAEGVHPDARGPRGRTAVTAAAMAERVDVVRLLVARGADVDLQDEDRNNPLLVCGENGNVALLREVLRAEPDLRVTNRFGGTALIPASDRGHVDMVRALLETEMPVDHVNDLGWTALLEAVILGDGGPAHEKIVRLLVDAGADTGIPDREGVTALEHARRNGYDDIVRILETARRSDP